MIVNRQPSQLTVVLLTLGFYAHPAFTQDGAGKQKPSAALAKSIETAQDTSTRLTIPVMVNNHGPFPFVIDTGAERTVISRELASSLHLPQGQQVSLHHIGGVAPIDTVIIKRLSVGGQEITDVSAPVLEHANLGAMGMVGLDSLHDRQVVLDFASHRLTLGFYAMDAVRSNPHTIVVDERRRLSQLVLVDADSHSKPIFVILDSGAQNTIGNEALRQLVTKDPVEKHRLYPGELLSVTGSRVPAVFDDITEIRIGGITIENVPIAFADIHTFKDFGVAEVPAMLLGMDVLGHFQGVSIDFNRGEASFLPK